MPTKDEVPPLTQEHAEVVQFHFQHSPIHPRPELMAALEAIASGQHIVIRNPAAMIKKYTKLGLGCRALLAETKEQGERNRLLSLAAAHEAIVRALAALIAGAGDE